MNKTFAVFANGGTMTTAQTALWQYDYGQILVVQGIELPNAYEVQFCNAGDSTTITSVGDSTGVVIPDQFLQNGETIYAYIYLHTGNTDGETEYKITIPVMDRAEPTDIEPTPAQESTIGQLIDALNAGVEAAEEAAEKGPQIIDGYWHIWDAEAGEYVNTEIQATGADGSGVWYTTERVSGDETPFVRRRDLIGREGATVQVHDLLFAPDVRDEGEPTTLYEITSVGTACALKRLCKMQGEDGTSPGVTITEIEGGHRVTITDEAHPQGQSFDVMDGQGGSGSSDYNDLSNKPQIAGVTLSGDKSLSDLGIAPKPMLVTLSYTGSGDTYTADKTYAEITDAIAAGREVLVDWGASILRPSALGATWIGYDDSQILEFILHSDSSWTGIITNLGRYRTAEDQNTIDQQQNTAIAAKYSKPSGGIPASDLASAVQTSLGKADTALQPGDVTEPLVATYTIDSLPDGSPVSATCDKTFSELATAMYAGTSIVCLVKYGAFPLAITGNVTSDFRRSIDASAVFGGDMFGRIVHNSDDTCTVDIEFFANGSIAPANNAPVSGDTVYNALLGKLDKAQGAEHAGEFCVVGSDGNITTVSMTAWQGGSF